MTNEEILKLAESCGMFPDDEMPELYLAEEQTLEAFYRAAYNAGLEAAAKVLDTQIITGGADGYAMVIRALKEMK